MHLARGIHCVDAHAEREPSRIVVGGVLDVPGTTMLEKMRALEADDRLRRVLLFAPRGSAAPAADAVFPGAGGGAVRAAPLRPALGRRRLPVRGGRRRLRDHGVLVV